MIKRIGLRAGKFSQPLASPAIKLELPKLGFGNARIPDTKSYPTARQLLLGADLVLPHVVMRVPAVDVQLIGELSHQS